MHKIIFFLVLFAFAGCTKQQTIVQTAQPRPAYQVSGLTDAVLDRTPFLQGQNAYLYLRLTYNYGEQKQLQLGVRGLPAGIRDSFQTPRGYPDFDTYLILLDKGAPAGSYTAQLTVRQEGDTALKLFPFKVVVQGNPFCAAYFAGKSFTGYYNGCNPVPPGSTGYKAMALQRSPTTDTLELENYNNDGNSLKLLPNCRSGNIVVPRQVINGNTVWGTGNLLQFYTSYPTVLALQLTQEDPQGSQKNCRVEFNIGQ